MNYTWPGGLGAWIALAVLILAIADCWFGSLRFDLACFIVALSVARLT